MTIAVMQPYIFPYLGYFQLIYAADRFVFYDDVKYIKQGWINRNKILINGNENMFSVPVSKPVQFSAINEVLLHPELFPAWKLKFLKSVTQAYKKAPYFDAVFPVIEEVMLSDSGNIGELAVKSITTVCNYLDLEREFFLSSVQFGPTKGVGRAERLIMISKILGGDRYINAIGGTELYSKEFFSERGMELEFLQPELNSYQQFGKDFQPGLSIIDVLMFNSVSETTEMLSNYSFLEYEEDSGISSK